MADEELFPLNAKEEFTSMFMGFIEIREAEEARIVDFLFDWFIDLYDAHYFFLDTLGEFPPLYPAARAKLKRYYNLYALRSSTTELERGEIESNYEFLEWAADCPMNRSEFMALLKMYRRSLNITPPKELKGGRNKLDTLIKRGLIPPPTPVSMAKRGAPGLRFFRTIHGRAARAVMALQEIGVTLKDIEYALKPLRFFLQGMMKDWQLDSQNRKIRKIEEWNASKERATNLLCTYFQDIEYQKSGVDVRRLLRQHRAEAIKRARKICIATAKKLTPDSVIFPGDYLSFWNPQFSPLKKK